MESVIENEAILPQKVGGACIHTFFSTSRWATATEISSSYIHGILFDYRVQCQWNRLVMREIVNVVNGRTVDGHGEMTKNENVQKISNFEQVRVIIKSSY